MNTIYVVNEALVAGSAPSARPLSPWLQLAAWRDSRRTPPYPRLTLRGDRRMLRDLRAAEMAAWKSARKISPPQS